MAIFAMGLHISEHEFGLLSELCRPAWVAMGLTNDIYSWDKEKQAADEAGDDHLCNSIWVLMKEHGIEKEEAENMCRGVIKENVANFVETVRGVHERKDISMDLRLFVETAQYMINGNVAWSKGAPRYNPGVMYNARQLEWMTNDTPKEVEAWDRQDKVERSVFRRERMPSFVDVVA
ncbi:isoprenoid synthase domain-containing protein [Podospora fimiseda]|uniref:Isoprenoid synthase domain-containing protein n=1 Tax=Podospora fimiseda TaxID=252190 RepID=A0AAN6YTF9_9PEZI|nr:isoprenoid synthase domain-containing protein [Podospora fimiseda]